MSFVINDHKLLKKHIKIWKRVTNLMNIEFYSEPVYGNKNKIKNI